MQLLHLCPTQDHCVDTLADDRYAKSPPRYGGRVGRVEVLSVFARAYQHGLECIGLVTMTLKGVGAE